MYTRSYYSDGGERINPPENYDGTALLGERTAITEESVESSGAPNKNPWEAPASVHEMPKNEEGESLLASITKIPFLSGIFGEKSIFQSLKMPKIGTEELLIIGVALFLLLSKDGDNECALILLLILLIN